LNYVAAKSGKVCRDAMSAMLADAAGAAASARRTYESLSAIGAVRHDKLQPIVATLAGVHDDAIALQAQVDSAYALLCKVTSTCLETFSLHLLFCPGSHAATGASEAAAGPCIRCCACSLFQLFLVAC
jgi:hypothetical protein